MAKTVFRKLLECIVSLFIISLLLYSVLYFLSGDGSSVILGEDVSNSAREVYIEENAAPGFLLGYFNSMRSFFSLRWGTTIRGEKIGKVVSTAIPVSLSLSFYALLFSFPLSLFISVLASGKKRGISDIFLSLFSSLFRLLPSFLVSIVLVLIFSSLLSLFPVAGYSSLSSGYSEHLKSLVLPSLSLSLLGSSYMLRIFREGLNETMDKTFITYARAKGMREKRIVISAALKPTLPLIISTTAQCMVSFIASSTVVETVFALPGLGRALVRAAGERDTRLAFVLVMIISLCVTFILFLSSFLTSLVDKRGENNDKA